MNYFVNSPVTQALGLSLFHFLWQGALIAAAAAVALKFAARAQTRYAIACGALLAMPAAFALTLALSIPQAPATTGHITFTPAYSMNIPPADPAPATRDFSVYLEYAVPLWLAGVVCVLLYRSVAWIAARRLRRRGTCEVSEAWIGRLKSLATRARVWQPVVLLESCLAEVPVVIGYLRPAILVPAGMLAGLPAAHIEAILLHELAHIRRADYLVALVQSVVEGLLFYHPAVWWISGVVRAERENCCDDFAVAIQGDPHAYATALATIEASRWRASDPVLASNQGDLVLRIRRILRASDPQDFSLPLIPAALLLIAAGIAIAEQAPQIAALPLKIPVPQAPLLRPFKKPLQIAQAQSPAQADSQMSATYRKWLNEDVLYIITDEERKAFKTLTTDEERDKFIEQFWLRRDPTPGTSENEFKTEHYRRIAYANSRFTADVPGWKTDRGRIYIQYGPPDEIESHPTGGAYTRPADQGGGTTDTAPFEQWRYRLIEGIGNNVIIEFVDTNHTGDYHVTTDPNEKDVVLLVAGAGLAAFPGRHIAVSAAFAGEATISIPLDFTDDVRVSGRAMSAVPLDPDSYVIQAGDMLQISVQREPEFTGQKAVRADGHITIPLVGSVQAVGLPPARLAAQLQEALATYIKSPVVTVDVTRAVPRILFDQPVSNPAGVVLVKNVKLARGSHTVVVMVRNLRTGATYGESADVEVR